MSNISYFIHVNKSVLALYFMLYTLYYLTCPGHFDDK